VHVGGRRALIVHMRDATDSGRSGRRRDCGCSALTIAMAVAAGAIGMSLLRCALELLININIIGM
jgi:hypothetical protein